MTIRTLDGEHFIEHCSSPSCSATLTWPWWMIPTSVLEQANWQLVEQPDGRHLPYCGRCAHDLPSQEQP